MSLHLEQAGNYLFMVFSDYRTRVFVGGREAGILNYGNKEEKPSVPSFRRRGDAHSHQWAQRALKPEIWPNTNRFLCFYFATRTKKRYKMG